MAKKKILIYILFHLSLLFSNCNSYWKRVTNSRRNEENTHKMVICLFRENCRFYLHYVDPFHSFHLILWNEQKKIRYTYCVMHSTYYGFFFSCTNQNLCFAHFFVVNRANISNERIFKRRKYNDSNLWTKSCICFRNKQWIW